MSLISDVSGAINSAASSVENALGITSGNNAPQGVPSAYAQTYRNQQVPNMRQAVYRLSIHAPNKARTPLETYTFPISPSNIRRNFTSMATFYDTPGTIAQHGVARLIDQYGIAPIVYDISGTTGWQKHLTDGFQYTGLQSIQRIQRMLLEYANLNAMQSQDQQNEFYTLEFYDYFYNEFYEVVPVGPQEIWQDQQKPILTNYQFHLVGVRSVAEPALPQGSTSDPIAAAFDTAVATVQNNVSTFMSGVTDIYQSAQNVVSNLL